MGEAIAEECRYYGVHTLLGPGVNIKRNPLCGRNFEYFSEDPLLAGTLGAAMVEGVQSGGVGVSLKHFALNNSENYRFMGNSVASENTIRELYLKPFEYIVKHAKPATVMCAYNQINGTYCSENKWLLTDVLRGEWGFDGVVMSDWGAVRDRVMGLEAGMDLEMPGDTAICRRRILDAVADKTLPMEDLDKACRNNLKWIDQYVKPADQSAVDWESHHKLAADIAADCAVLSVADKQAKEAETMPDGPEKDNKRKGAQFLRRVLMSNSLRSISMTAGSFMPYNYAQGFVELTNGHLFKGISCFMKKIKVPKLPKEEQ